jgi:hypothetical protein
VTPAQRQPVEGVEGTVVRRRVGTGTKSERDAVVLVTEDGAYALRRKGANAFQDDDLDQLVGRRVRASGLLVPGQLIADDLQVLDDP